MVRRLLYISRSSTSVLQVTEVRGEDVVCLIKNSAALGGQLYTLHVSQIRIDLPTLTDKDKEVNYLHQILPLNQNQANSFV